MRSHSISLVEGVGVCFKCDLYACLCACGVVLCCMCVDMISNRHKLKDESVYQGVVVPSYYVRVYVCHTTRACIICS